MFIDSPPTKFLSSVYPPLFEVVILFYCVMIDRYKKLVTVAEAMVAEQGQFADNVCQMSVGVHGGLGVVVLGMFGITSSTYYSDENQYMPEYGITYKEYHFFWVEDEWVTENEKKIEREVSATEDLEDLPF